MMDRDFKGVWIPKEIWLSKDLSLQEKGLLVEIDSLSNAERGCFASNEYLAEFLGLSKERARKVIASLISKGFVTSEIEYRSGTKEIAKRWLKTTIPYGRNCPPPMVENDHDSNIEGLIKKRDIKKNPSREEVRAHVKEKGYHFNADEFYDYYDSANWHKADGKPVKNWKQCCVTWESNRKDKLPQKTVSDDRRKRLE